MKRIVIKVGSSVLTENNAIARIRMLNLVTFIAKLRKKYEVILVSSGAVAAGYTALKLDRNVQISKKVLASVGQPILMSSYKNKFDIYGVDTAQILLTQEDFDSKKRTKIFQQIIDMSIENGILPIVNENDISTSPDQLFGDNDQLSAHITHYTNSDMLIILSDIAGYYDSNPNENSNAKIIKVVSEIPKNALEEQHSPNNEFATGGIVTKLKAAEYLMKYERDMFLCSGFDLESAEEYFLNDIYKQGTLFTTKK